MLSGNYIRKLKEIDVPKMLFHVTPYENVDKILKEGLKVNMPQVLSLTTKVNAIFCSISSKIPNVVDLFIHNEDYGIIAINTEKILDHKWYIDIFVNIEYDGKNKHVMTFDNIPSVVLKEVKGE